MTTTERTIIEKRARAILGRPVSRRHSTDWAAAAAIAAAYAEAGKGQRLDAWVPQGRSSLRALADAYALRYLQAYGLGA